MDYKAGLAGRGAAPPPRPDMTAEEADRRVIRIVAWAAREHTRWFWAGVGEWRDA
jgi:hypothetical protein